MKIHGLKTWSGFFTALKKGDKTFELRKNDRDFIAGDQLLLQEFQPCDTCWGSGKVFNTACGCPRPHGSYTGEVLLYNVTYVLKQCAGLQRDYVIMSIQRHTPENI
jgi:hypothetical protein